ncbi:IclR family transcriptional regulator [Rhodovibrionaceae bacterium A322]
MDKDKEGDRKFATTLARGLSVLRAFRPSDGPIGNQEIAERTGLPKSTISRLTYTLTMLGYLDHLKNIEKYRLGPAVLTLGNVARANLPFMDISSPIMQQLADETGTLAALTVRDGLGMLYAHCWRPRDVASIWLEVGRRIPVYGTASGLCYLACIPDDDRQRLYAELRDSGISAKELKTIERDVERSQQDMITRGYVTSVGGWVKTINAVAVPFRSRELSQSYVFNCGALADSLSEQQLHDSVGPALARRVRELEMTMGQTPLQSGY